MASKSTYGDAPKKKPKKPTKPTTPAAPTAPLYSWNGGPKTHTITYGQHQDNVKTKAYGLTPGQPLDAPFTPAQGIQYAESAAGREFDPLIQQNQSLGQATPVWYQNFVNQVGAEKVAQQQYAAPLLAQAQAGVANAAQTAPGIDPSSPQYGVEQQAAKAREALAQLGASTLASQATAGDQYLTGLQSTAQRDLPGAMAYVGSQGAALKQARGARANEVLGEVRTGAQNYGIAQATLGMNQVKTAADIAIAAGKDPTTGKDLPKDPEKAILGGAFAGLTSSQVTALSPADRQTYIDNYNKVTHPPKTTKDPDALTPAQKRAADKAEKDRVGKIRAATGKLKAKVSDVMDYQQTLIGHMGEDTDKPRDASGNYPTRKVTQRDVDQMKVSKYGKLGEIAIAVRSGKKLTQAQIDYLHGLDPNYRIPREWTADRTQAQDPHSTGKTPDKAPGAHGHI